MSNVIKQIVADGEYGLQTIKMIVKDNERGPQGEKGEPGTAATIAAGNAYSIPSSQQPAVINTGSASDAVFDFYIPKGEKGEPGIDGRDGAIQYSAGAGIKIENNVISATGGGGSSSWGQIGGNIENQIDLQQEFAKYTPSSNLATVATSGSYNDLSNTPTIPAAQVNSDWNANSGVSQILNKPTLATVATSGAYSDLSGTPTIPVVNDTTITITNNGTTVDSFTTNASAAKTIALDAPVFTVTSTDPGEGQPLATNHFIAVYEP